MTTQPSSMAMAFLTTVYLLTEAISVLTWYGVMLIYIALHRDRPHVCRISCLGMLCCSYSAVHGDRGHACPDSCLGMVS